MAGQGTERARRGDAYSALKGRCAEFGFPLGVVTHADVAKALGVDVDSIGAATDRAGSR